jgi:penicillin-binding protein 1A
VSNSAGVLEEDYQDYPFNLASEAERQPGSAFKPFTLAVALEHGYGPSSLMYSAPADFVVPNSGGKEIFHVRNFGNAYSGAISLQAATDYSDNSVYARLGIQGLGRNGTKLIKRMAVNAGIRTPVSTNYAMILGGLKVGVSPLDMAHAYETFAAGGRRVYPSLGSYGGPTGIAEIKYDHRDLKDKPSYRRVMPASIAQELHSMLTGPVQAGTATQAAISGVVVAGKTGTSTNYADAWFVGWTPQMTTAVWVGFPNKLVSMSTLFNGGPVEGGTFPAIIWHAFMVQALQILASEQPNSTNTSTTTTATVPSTSAVAPASTSQATTPATSNSKAKSGTANGGTANGGNGVTAGGGATGGGGGTGAGTGTGAGAGTGAGTEAGGGTGSGSGTGSGGSGLGPGGGTGSGG